ncbi:sigma-54 interaction domain-containing protein [Calderihabitans maritimus]|uniref:HTH-type transcriptional regulatory protein TyrR n=1 Tax=Calderihabitans maritimus TaxID=1246530 RepID=A0A1Z5HUI5_9FIRM|nr:sigma 54-interacting transcriptional regulator [Calderihabitans maritimus]GAW93068.1 PAS domain S-box [Calderihabitans maritimus]
MDFKFQNSLKKLPEDVDVTTFLEHNYDVLYVSNGNGDTLMVSSASKELFGYSESELVGVNVRELERKRVFFPSATLRVLEHRSPVTLFQETKPGKRLFVFSSPVFDETGKIVRVVNFSKDITEVTELEKQLEKARTVVEKYRQELARVRCEQLLKERMMVIGSSKMEGLMKLVQKVAQVDTTVLITGESGVGKEVVAKAIHKLSKRSGGPFVAINCGAIPQTLLESELFGYEKGAFTGANKEGKAGLMEAAHGGTLFLDEVADLPLEFQVKLLRVLQERKVLRIGSTAPRRVDVRVIAATNKDLSELVTRGQFRQDLYYRLNVVPIEVPPLRERIEEIPLFVDFFLNKFNQKYGIVKRISEAAVEVLSSYTWPGNVRELENIIERLVVTTDKDIIDIGDLPETIRKGTVKVSTGSTLSLKELINSIEYEIIYEAYKRYKNTYAVAEILGVSQPTVARKLKAGPSIAVKKFFLKNSIINFDNLFNSILNFFHDIKR